MAAVVLLSLMIVPLLVVLVELVARDRTELVAKERPSLNQR